MGIMNTLLKQFLQQLIVITNNCCDSLHKKKRKILNYACRGIKSSQFFKN